MTREALLTIDGRSARQGRRLDREWVDRAARGGGDASHEGVRSGGDGIGWGGAVDHRPQGTELRVGDCAHSDGQRRSVEPRLIEKLARLVHFGGGRDPPAPRHHAGGVLLGGKRCGGDDASRHRQGVRPLPVGFGHGTCAQQQADKQLTTDGDDSQSGGAKY